MAKETVKAFWSEQPATIESMFLLPGAHLIDQIEREEILALLPFLQGKEVLDLPAGVGRFTHEFAKRGAKVTAVDLMPHFIEANREYNQIFSEVKYLAANALDLSFPPSSFDLIFINWLFIYLDDEEAKTLIDRLVRWLKPGGHLFVKETCAAVEWGFEDRYYARYRRIATYERWFGSFSLREVHSGSLQVFIDWLADPFRCFWLYEKN